MTILSILSVVCWGLALAGLTWYCLQAAREILSLIHISEPTRPY